MLCKACRVHVRPDFPYCLHCGALRPGVQVAKVAPPVLRRADDPMVGTLLTEQVTTIGRSSGNGLVLGHSSVSRKHAQVVRTEVGFVVEDLGSLNGVTVAGRRLPSGGWAPLAEGQPFQVGDVQVLLEQPRNGEVGSRTQLAGTQFTRLSGATQTVAAPTAREPLTVRPRRRGGWALKQAPGGRHWVLGNTRTNQYLQLDDRDAFIWSQIDGAATVRDLVFAYAEKYGELALPKIEQALRTFASIGLVRGLSGQRAEEDRHGLSRVGHAIFKSMLRLQISIKGFDAAVTRLYRSIGWWFFTRSWTVLAWVIVIAGLAGFVLAQSRQRLFDVGGAGLAGLLASGALYLGALTVHETAHALAVKSYGRKVNKAGFMVMMAMPFAFVDTSDMWFGDRRSRLVVSLSGPFVTLVMAGGLALGAAYLPDARVSGICFQAAFGLYLNTLYNLNPLMPLDGYQALADALRMPRLREEALSYFTRGLWRDLRHGHRPGLRGVGMAMYGVASLVGMVLMLALAGLMWRSRLGGLVDRYLYPPWNLVAIGAGLALVLFPIWYQIGKKLRTRLNRS